MMISHVNIILKFGQFDNMESCWSSSV
jgi:hypothetical protein